MEPVSWAVLIVAAISAFGSWATARASGKATITNAEVTARVEMEKEAYGRARAFDISTIERQDQEILELREENKEIRTENQELRRQIQLLERRLSSLEKEVHDDDH